MRPADLSGGLGWIKPPASVLAYVFDAQTRASWRAIPTPSDELIFRQKVLEADGSPISDPSLANRVRSLRAQKVAWETYLYAAYACEMFSREKGSDLLGRLRGADDDGFRSAMAECMTCWFLAGRMKLRVDPCAPGRDGKNLEMRILTDAGEIGVEVKAPFRPMPMPPPGQHAVVWVGDDADKIEECLKAANKQFSQKIANVFVIVPQLRTRMFTHREDLVKAAYGQSKIVVPIDRSTGMGGTAEVRFFPEGKFFNTQRPGGKPLKPDGFPAHRRISAIVCIEEKLAERYPLPDPFILLNEESRGELCRRWREARDLHFSNDNTKWIEHDVLVLHNPFALHPLEREIWNEFPQFLPVDGKMIWTDGYSNAV